MWEYTLIRSKLPPFKITLQFSVMMIDYLNMLCLMNYGCCNMWYILVLIAVAVEVMIEKSKTPIL